MDYELRFHAAKQGIGSIFLPTRCSVCNYLALDSAEQLALIRVASECPNCKSTGRKALISLTKYADVANWVGEYAISENSRDHVSAVLMCCALVESCLEEFIQDYVELHPGTKSHFHDTDKVEVKDVLGISLTQALEAAPVHLRPFPATWKGIRKKRTLFIHGKSSSLHIRQEDAHSAMDLVPLAIEVYAWLNNRYCLREVSSATP
jgi:hypothetical protein